MSPALAALAAHANTMKEIRAGRDARTLSRAECIAYVTAVAAAMDDLEKVHDFMVGAFEVPLSTWEKEVDQKVRSHIDLVRRMHLMATKDEPDEENLPLYADFAQRMEEGITNSLAAVRSFGGLATRAN